MKKLENHITEIKEFCDVVDELLRIPHKILFTKMKFSHFWIKCDATARFFQIPHKVQ